jgi:cellulose synthase/poly-beta-1,6-N-acetylglucosamine synthase-like glycosyltransferase/peptidoglycan/xylan/chitin deacetylase (PgdA/CDA1 family)
VSRPRFARGARRRDAASVRRRLWRPPAHWWLLAFCLSVVLALISFQGIATHTVGSSSESHPSNGAAPLQSTRPLLTAHGDSLSSTEPPPGHRIALTFDDGPDPRWTPRIAAVLRRDGVRAAFLVIGSQAARHPDLVRMLVRDGDEIGNHTFTHTALSSVPLWQARLQLDLTEAVLVGITGHYSRLMRPPYSATPDAVTPAEEQRLATLIGRRYVIALADLDSNDWQRNGVPAILRAASPTGAQGGIVMFHDGGGDRSETVTAVARLIPILRARGFQFVTLAQLSGVPESVLSPVAPAAAHSRGELFTLSVRLAFTLVSLLSYGVLLIGILVALRFALLLALASHHVRSTRRRPPKEHLPRVTVIVPAYNEQVGIERAIRSLAASDYPSFDVVVVDDGSTDRTAEIVEGLALPRVVLVRQDNTGKAAALSTGVRLSESEIIVMVDGDTVFEPDTIRCLVEPLSDPNVAAVSGNTKVGNRGGLLGRWQHIEYVSGFNLDRRMYEVLQCTPTVPGAIGAFRRDVLDEVGGVSGDTLAEDTDLTLAIGRTGRRVVYAERARAWTEAPSTLGGIWRQRYRWSFGTMQAVWKHRSAVFSRDPRQRGIGHRALPYIILFQILLPIVAPMIDLFALYGVIFTNPIPVIGAWLAFNAAQAGLAAFAFRLDHESLRPLWALPVQQFVYRQLMYLVIIESTISAVVGIRAHWQTIPRTGDVQVDPAPSSG